MSEPWLHEIGGDMGRLYDVYPPEMLGRDAIRLNAIQIGISNPNIMPFMDQIRERWRQEYRERGIFFGDEV